MTKTDYSYWIIITKTSSKQTQSTNQRISYIFTNSLTVCYQIIWQYIKLIKCSVYYIWLSSLVSHPINNIKYIMLSFITFTLKRWASFETVT